MYCIRTDRFSLFFPLRCASRTITVSLVGKTHTELKDQKHNIWVGKGEFVRRMISTSENNNIMVLRNPKERFLAGKWVADSMRAEGILNSEEHYFTVLKNHAAPVYYSFLDQSEWKEVNFQIMLFDRIGEYFPNVHLGKKERKKTSRWLKKYDTYFDHWQEEIDAYNFLLNNKRQIVPELFIPLLKDSSHINIKGVPGKRFKPLC